VIRRALLYWRTVRYLRPVQIYGRALRRIARPRIAAAPTPRVRTRSSGNWAAPARREASLVAPERFRLLGETHELGDIGWDDPSLDLLWRYNLHYFDDLNAVGAPERITWHRSLLRRWVAENPPARGTGWEPYPTSLRIVNWIKWALAGNALDDECTDSLAVQTRWLRARMEGYLLGNHLVSNAKALVFAGAFFDGPEASSWLATGLGVLADQLPEQILADGGHFERSTMYHALALEDLEDLQNLARAYTEVQRLASLAAPPNLPARIAAMRHWLAAMCHPDGEIGYFNDAAVGIAPAPSELEGYAARLGLPGTTAPMATVEELSPSGYVRVQTGRVVALLDVAPVGPDYLPAHAHADTLSFEMSLGRQRVFVNGGTSRYGESPERLKERGTAAHNTVVVDGVDSSEVWGGFRVARRARPQGLQVAEHDREVTVRCAHDGYRRLAGRVIHSRRWTFGSGSLAVTDELLGTFRSAEARLHIHPSIAVRADGHAQAVLVLADGAEVRVAIAGGALRVASSEWHPRFGVSVPTTCLVITFWAPRIRTDISWSPGT